MAHQKLPHLGVANNSPHVRYQVYFRVQHTRHENLIDQWLDDLMMPFEGVKQGTWSMASVLRAGYFSPTSILTAPTPGVELGDNVWSFPHAVKAVHSLYAGPLLLFPR